jgi:peptide deformylase
MSGHFRSIALRLYGQFEPHGGRQANEVTATPALAPISFLCLALSMSSKLSIVKYGNPILRKKGEKITVFDAELKAFAKAMHTAMLTDGGVGLAGQQVGKALQICVIEMSKLADSVSFHYELDGKTPPLNLIMPLVLINPVVKLDRGETCFFDEGCLSFPGIRADIERPSTLTVRYQDVDGAQHILTCDGYLARAVEHEIDHLNGILFIDRMSKSDLKHNWAELEAIKNSSSL